MLLLNSTVFICHDSYTVYSPHLTSCFGFWWTNRKDLPPSWQIKNQKLLQQISSNETNRYILSMFMQMIWLKREVGYKNVSLFGKLSRFSWNYGGLCSNFAPNSLSIEGRYGYAAVPHKERQDQSSVLSRKAGGRKRDGDMMGLCINLYHTCATQTSASSWRRSRKRQ